MGQRRRLPIGAEPVSGGVHFRVWAADRRNVSVVVEGGGETPLDRQEGGYFAGLVTGAGPGTRYRFLLDGNGPFPDPASRFQPDGPHGPSEVVDPAFAWSDGAWPGVRLAGQVFYEMHVGTFTDEGTFAAAARELPALREVGVTTVELMPVAEFPGRFGWGYDGVDLFAPCRLYGRPDDLRRFVDRAHALGMGVLLDVVYNHFGPSGNYLPELSKRYFRQEATEWGLGIAFDGEGSGPVREYFVSNARYWIDEFHADGFRVDAAQATVDRSSRHILADVAAAAREAAGRRAVLVVAENERQEAHALRPPEQGGWGFDAVWNDDFHHAAVVALTGRKEAYYSDYLGGPQELISAAKRGYLYQGQRYEWQKARRGTPALGVAPRAFVTYLDNHDQVANTGSGERLYRLTSPGRFRAATALLLLGPGTPLLFQGQEWGAPEPFRFFADHGGELGAAVFSGRRDFMAQFPSSAAPEMGEALADPGDEATFRACRLGRPAGGAHAELRALHRDLLALRREDPVLSLQGERGLDGAVLGAEALCLRFFAGDGGDRLLLVNLGRDLPLVPAPEPLLAPPEGRAWHRLLSTEDPRYGGRGTPPVEDDGGWRLPGHAAVLFGAERI